MRKSEIIGQKTEILDSKDYVTQIWCKLCSKYGDQIVSHSTIKGAAVSAARAFWIELKVSQNIT